MTAPANDDAAIVTQVEAALASDKPIRLDFANGGRLHMDRPLPFLCVHLSRRKAPAARDVASANAAYLIVRKLSTAAAVIAVVGAAMREKFGSFVLLDIGELDRDLLAEDAAYLPPFEMTLSASEEPAAQKARAAFAGAVEGVDAAFRSPRLDKLGLQDDPHAKLARLVPGYAFVTVRFAPIYRVPGSDGMYPDLRERLVANIFDAGLQAVAAFVRDTGSMAPSTHRALGRQVFIDAVRRADRAVDEVAQSFDFLLAVTPINAGDAWEQFKESGFQRAPRLLYRPLTVQVDAQKKALFSVALEHFEDPVLSGLYREKQQELDLQLSLLAARETPRFIELGRALYGPVEPALLKAAEQILAETARAASKRAAPGERDEVDSAFVERKAQSMIDAYASHNDAFAARVELRDDLPSGLMVSGGKLMISRSTQMARGRVEALLSHEVGVHLLTYFNGSAQGLRLFRSGLAGYEGIQEGLAVLAEYLVGGMTVARLRLIAGRVVASAAMLEGAGFRESFDLLVKEHGFKEPVAFNLTLRIYRGGGLVKDAIYLRGLLEILSHLRGGGSLDPFWMGKIAAVHFSIIQELGTRGLLKAPQLMPAFLTHKGAEERLAVARAGLSPIQMIAN